MKASAMVATANLGVVFLLLGSISEGAELKVLSAGGFRHVMEDLGPKFERMTGHNLAITQGNLGEIVKRVRRGETPDIVIIPRQGIEGFVSDGKVSPENVTVIARSLIGVAVRKGAPIPDISTPDALRRVLVGAKSIAYSNPAQGSADGPHFAKVLDRLGIAEEMKPKTVFPKLARLVGELVAKGEAEIGVQQLQNLVSVAGIEIVGLLPDDLQWTEVFAAAIMNGVQDAAASKALVSFLRTSEAVAVIKAKGMEPPPQ